MSDLVIGDIKALEDLPPCCENCGKTLQVDQVRWRLIVAPGGRPRCLLLLCGRCEGLPDEDLVELAVAHVLAWEALKERIREDAREQKEGEP